MNLELLYRVTNLLVLVLLYRSVTATAEAFKIAEKVSKASKSNGSLKKSI